MKSKIKYIAVIVMVIILFIIPGCDGDTIKPPPPESEVFFDISGYDSLRFEAPVWGTRNKSSKQYNYSGILESKGKNYYLAISIFYKGDDLKTGAYNFRRTIDTVQEYAVGSFTIGKGINEKVFMSDSGRITVTELIGMSIKATFKFYASLTDGTGNVIIENGILINK